jgi:hypothetical protein
VIELAIEQTEGVGKELGDAYRTLAVHLTLLAPEGTALRTRCTRELQEHFPQLVPAVAVAYVGEANLQAAEKLRVHITERGIAIWRGADDLESTQSQQRLTAVLPYLRHLVVVVSTQTINAAALRRFGYETRQRGVWLHLVDTSYSAAAFWSGDFPPVAPPCAAL